MRLKVIFQIFYNQSNFEYYVLCISSLQINVREHLFPFTLSATINRLSIDNLAFINAKCNFLYILFEHFSFCFKVYPLIIDYRCRTLIIYFFFPNTEIYIHLHDHLIRFKLSKRSVDSNGLFLQKFL